MLALYYRCLMWTKFNDYRFQFPNFLICLFITQRLTWQVRIINLFKHIKIVLIKIKISCETDVHFKTAFKLNFIVQWIHLFLVFRQLTSISKMTNHENNVQEKSVQNYSDLSRFFFTILIWILSIIKMYFLAGNLRKLIFLWEFLKLKWILNC